MATMRPAPLPISATRRPREVGRAEKRRHDVGEQLRRAVEPVAVAIVRPLLAEIPDRALFERSSGAGGHHQRAPLPSVPHRHILTADGEPTQEVLEPPTAGGRYGGKKRMYSVSTGDGPGACRSSRAHSAGWSSTALASMGARATIQRVIGFQRVVLEERPSSPPGRTTRIISRTMPSRSAGVDVMQDADGGCRDRTRRRRTATAPAHGMQRRGRPVVPFAPARLLDHPARHVTADELERGATPPERAQEAGPCRSRSRAAARPTARCAAATRPCAPGTCPRSPPTIRFTGSLMPAS